MKIINYEEFTKLVKENIFEADKLDIYIHWAENSLKQTTTNSTAIKIELLEELMKVAYLYSDSSYRTLLCKYIKDKLKVLRDESN